eukprot:TRINITY_DN2107_c0_g1_i1.p1 TRINITY_DN2107_c0_g1~~TRINITY_DN2107_c0_g1_i1.p1  ORF type:complete len:263 (-),score=83.35 TRINITY_DN2107_c0_g1_i1:1151-1903(-)
MTAENVERLYHHMRAHERQRSLQRTRLAYDKSLASQYRALAAEEEARLSSIGLGAQHLSVPGLMHLHQLTSLAIELNIADPRLHSYASALYDLGAREWEAALELERLQSSADRYMALSAHMVTELERVRRIRAVAEEQHASNEATLKSHAANLPYFVSKSKEYLRQINDMKGELQQSGARPHLLHHQLVAIADEIGELDAAMAPGKATLAAYKDLPPDISLARVKLEQEKQRLARLEQQLQEQITSMNYE